MRWLDSITNSVSMNLSKLQEIVKNREAWRGTVHGSQRAGHDLVTEKQRLNGGKFQNQERVPFYPIIQSNVRGKTKLAYNKINKMICPQMYLSMIYQQSRDKTTPLSVFNLPFFFR